MRILADSRTPEALADEIQSGLEHWKKHPDWLKKNGEFVPMPMTFLNQERWVVEDGDERDERNDIRAFAEELCRKIDGGVL